MTVVDHVKLFRNLPELRFDGRMHEQILTAIRRTGGDVAWTELHVVHSGSDRSPAAQAKKARARLRLLTLELAERPEHPFTRSPTLSQAAWLGLYADSRTRLAEAEQLSGEMMQNGRFSPRHCATESSGIA